MTQATETPKVFAWQTALLMALAIAVAVTLAATAWWSWGEVTLQDVVLKAVALWALLFSVSIMIWLLHQGGLRSLVEWPYRQQAVPEPQPVPHLEMLEHLQLHYGRFWRWRVRVLLVVGEPGQIEAIAPGLATDRWLEGQGTVLLWGGSIVGKPAQEQAKYLKDINARRPLDGIVWALSDTQSADAKTMTAAARYLRDLSSALNWQLPLHLWQVCAYQSQPQDFVPPVGCLLSSRATLAEVEEKLDGLVDPLNKQGIAVMRTNMRRDFLFRLGYELRVGGITRWRQALEPLLPQLGRAMPLRGLHFSLARQDGQVPGMQHLLQLDGAWAYVLADRYVRGWRRGWWSGKAAAWAMLALAGVALCGVVMSFVDQRNQLDQVGRVIELPMDDISTLTALTVELDRLAQGEPWYPRFFGVSQHHLLMDALWSRYEQANNPLLRDVAAAHLTQQFQAPAADQTYRALKAYLMMANPEQADPVFLAQTLEDAVPAPPGLWSFYARHLPAHPQWRIEPDPTLITQARRTLLAALSQRNSEAQLYQQLIKRVGSQYPALDLAQLAGDTDAGALFISQTTVPGAFTRQAWEGQVRSAIDDLVDTRRDTVDWVLGDLPPGKLDPDALKTRLTQRYTQDFSGAWQRFLNNIQWRPADSLAGAIAQLALMSDAHLSPLLALMGNVAAETQGIVPTPVPGPSADPQLSVPSYLTAVTRLRLKLQQVHSANDAQALFQGQNADFAEARDQGRLIAAGLGSQWGEFGQTLFVEPLQQSWQHALQPSAERLNHHWQRAIVDHWNASFNGRYPFVATGSDISLPMLGQMIRADTGRIEQFLQQQLGGVLRKEGSRWVPDPRQGQALRISPAFLDAVNQLATLADVLYTDGGLGLGFELRAKPVRDVVQTTLVFNGERLHYFNQKERWQHFTWPGRGDYPGTRLTWTSVHAGERLLGDYAGTWGLIRLLERAQVTALDDSDTHFSLVLKAPDGLPLTWHLRTELGAGPLALLTLRGFTLPKHIFLTAL